MILFLNFAPIQFMGGAEKWMNDTAKKVNKYEPTSLISVHPSIANIYSQFVLKRKFDTRAKPSQIHNHTQLTAQSFIPFSESWTLARNNFKKARLIYIRYEILELLIVFFFSGIPGIKKTIAGIHSPLIYNDPQSLLDSLHNFIYKSKINLFILGKMQKVHVLNKSVESFLNHLNLNNVVYVPNGIKPALTNTEQVNTDKSALNIISVGELSIRKGTDILITIINKSPKHVTFTIVGDGYLKNDIEALAKNSNNVKFLGHLESEKLQNIYQEMDALLLPSRAESLPLVVLEAMSHGLVIINSKNTSLGIDQKVEYTATNKQDYLFILKTLETSKKTSNLNKKHVRRYFDDNFSTNIVDPLLYSKVFSISL